ncbi:MULTISPECIES: spherulation-specific family 4 protein [unclassified Streptomyces]|uniref:spherulation-specific family 4 protein n=1 Tax=unclassified Streptomyces TaxID=2593676 RepID=UPI002DD910B4|nr:MULTISPECIES: spherulation-specific family 4 protein [unclassified Streptomyces]WSA92502.1 spherulation-specific family 4 protein [Streptomyces sp. NBC_01795]WSB76868.1 spherulation-specific family 4 protein [Streptomyces sp. NBC_01775]WSS43693.1 spherulation-specific family 4 protein [Streptomyces sp. NBC_01187]
MPHLTTPGEIRHTDRHRNGASSGAPHRAPHGAPDGREEQPALGLGVLGRAHPMLAPTEWAELARPGLSAFPGPAGRRGPLHWAVLNVADGPGARRDPYCSPAVTALRASGVAVLGHLDMRDGERTFGELVSEAHRFLDWYRVDGFYLAGCPADSARLAYVQRATATLRALCEGGHLVLGHCTHPHPGYARCADQLVTFTGSWAEYRWSQAEEWTAGHPAERFCHLVHSLPRTHLEEALRIARWQGAGTVCFTDRTGGRDQDPWAGLPGYWDEIVSRVGPGISE